MDRPATGPSLLDHFAALEDPRQQAKALYPLPEILLLLLCATLAGADDVAEVGIWGRGEPGLPAPPPALPARHPEPSMARRPSIRSPKGTRAGARGGTPWAR